MAIRKRYKLWTGLSDDRGPLLEIEDLRPVDGSIAMDVIDLETPPAWDELDSTTLVRLTEDQARELVVVLRRMLGEISETQLTELLAED